MEKELISTECQQAVESIKLSDETKALLKCKAMLSDVYQTVSNACLSFDSRTCDERTEKFYNKLEELNNELMIIIGDVVEIKSVQTDYKEI